MKGLAVIALLLWPAAAIAGEMHGVVMPDVCEVGGRTLVLNGMATRLYSFLRIPVYVAGLYLERRDSDAAAILASPAPKLIQMQALRSASRNDIIEVWRSQRSSTASLPQE
jgi:hypothetical protein